MRKEQLRSQWEDLRESLRSVAVHRSRVDQGLHMQHWLSESLERGVQVGVLDVLSEVGLTADRGFDIVRISLGVGRGVDMRVRRVRSNPSLQRNVTVPFYTHSSNYRCMS